MNLTHAKQRHLQGDTYTNSGFVEATPDLTSTIQHKLILTDPGNRGVLILLVL